MGFVSVLSIFICIIPFMLARNAINWCVKFSGAKPFACCPGVCLLVSRTNECFWDTLLCFSYAKELKLD
jgi:hypothetical protein